MKSVACDFASLYSSLASSGLNRLYSTGRHPWPVRGGPVLGVRTYTFLIGKAVVRGESEEERSGFFDYTRLRNIYKHLAIEASNVPHCRKAAEALSAALY
jgi:hypothetical protein